MNKRKKTGRTSRPVLINQLTRVLKPLVTQYIIQTYLSVVTIIGSAFGLLMIVGGCIPCIVPMMPKGNSLTEIWKNKGVVYYLRCSDVQELVLKLLKHEIIKTKENVKAERKETFKPERRARL